MATSMEFSYPSTSTSTISENTFLQSVHNHFVNALRYEDKILLMKARACVPVERLHILAIKRMRNLQKEIKINSLDVPELYLEEALLIELVNWFKTSFFFWVDSPGCRLCDGVTKYSHNTVKIENSTSIRVEVFKCIICNAETEFPRYNDPGKLLITRQGRCGEWGNCFTLICRAMKYDARLVIDNTDHLWTEVYSPILKKWLHCDPCENVIDAPLMYEAGWGKKLNYIMAYSKDEVQDVTWRYSSNHRELLTRRNMCTEDELISTMMAMRENRWETLSSERKKYVQKRICLELVELMNEREPTENEKNGRSSGSLDWRLQRKETTCTPYVWKIGQHKEVCIRYRTSTDSYEMTSPHGKTAIRKKDWMSGIYETKDVFRKEEIDWKMVYLARKEGSERAYVTWKFRVDNNDKMVDRLKIKVSSQAFQSGEIEWLLCHGDYRIKIPKCFEKNFALENFGPLTEFTLSANLSGGEGQNAWQHSQILRQSMDSRDFPFQITIKLKKRSQFLDEYLNM